MAKRQAISLASLAKSPDPFAKPDLLRRVLRGEKSENKHLEWKLTPPFGKDVTPRTKYRMVKAIISFANTEGGFVVFGIENTGGRWKGFNQTELRETDLSKISELVNGCTLPEITDINLSILKHANKLFPVLHVAPSSLMPHVVTKPFVDSNQSGKSETILMKHGVYCRNASHSDLATAAHYNRMISRRVDSFKSETLRRIKEVEVLTPISGKGRGVGRGMVTSVSRLTNDPAAPAFRRTNNPDEASTILIHEEVSDHLFEEINNVLKANKFLSSDEHSWELGENVYYRMYSERHSVKATEEDYQMLVEGALYKIHPVSPMIYWLTKMRPARVAHLMKVFLDDGHDTRCRILVRLAILLGNEVIQWLTQNLEKIYGGHTQKPQFYYTFKEIIKSNRRWDARALCIRLSPTATLEVLGGKPIKVSDLLQSSTTCQDELTAACMSVFSGDTRNRTLCRQLDVLAYGLDLKSMAAEILSELSVL